MNSNDDWLILLIKNSSEYLIRISWTSFKVARSKNENIFVYKV